MKINPQDDIIELLMVEDSPDDVELTIEALKEIKLVINFNSVEDGVEAMAYLNKEGKYVNATRPDIILLDLNMPRKDGREVLEELKAEDNLTRIPVVVLTTSNA